MHLFRRLGKAPAAGELETSMGRSTEKPFVKQAGAYKT